jgi:hypothetical protein
MNSQYMSSIGEARLTVGSHAGRSKMICIKLAVRHGSCQGSSWEVNRLTEQENGLEKKFTNVLRSLQYFEAVARRRSVKLAASDLGVTQSAVSHQVRRFSEAIGQQLIKGPDEASR